MTAKGDKKIYTRTGDKGETSLIEGKRIPKYDLRIESYGTVDELNSIIGMLRDQAECLNYFDVLLKIQDRLFTIESCLATVNKDILDSLSLLSDNDVASLEEQIDMMSSGLPEQTHFIIPGGHTAVSWAHIARTVCRRAERMIVELSSKEKVPEIIVCYMNRLSDYLFVLARRLCFNLGLPEINWISDK